MKITKDAKELFGLILAMLMVAGFILLMIYMLTHNDQDKYMLQIGICIGLIVSKVGTIYDYYFGSSKGSSDKTDLLNAK